MNKLQTIKFPEELDAELRRYAEKTGESKSALVREAVAEYLARRKSATDSAYNLAADLAGSVEGPGDLSYNPERMIGFGSSRTERRSDHPRHRPPRRVSRQKR